MKAKKTRRHTLLLYKRSLDRKWMATLPLGLLMLGWMSFSGKYWNNIGYIPGIPAPYDIVFFIATMVILAFTAFAMVIRNLAYVQVKQDHIRLVTPFLVVKISFRRIRRVHPSHLTQIFPPEKTKGSLRNLVGPHYGKTAVALDLNGYPVSPLMIRLFIGKHIFLPEGEGLVLVVSDWMKLSTEIDTYAGAWKQRQSRSGTHKDPAYGLLQSLRKK